MCIVYYSRDVFNIIRIKKIFNGLTADSKIIINLYISHNTTVYIYDTLFGTKINFNGNLQHLKNKRFVSKRADIINNYLFLVPENALHIRLIVVICFLIIIIISKNKVGRKIFFF